MENEDEQSGLMGRIRKILPGVKQEHLDAEAKESPLFQYLEESLGEEIPEHMQGAIEDEYSKLAPKGWDKQESADDGTSTGPDQQMDGGTYSFAVAPGWITDKRSGSAICDIVIPKDGSSHYDAVIRAHDCAYSGVIPRALADELLYQGLVKAGICEAKAGIAFYAVRAFGASAFYPLGKDMPYPYANNRRFERFTFEVPKC